VSESGRFEVHHELKAERAMRLSGGMMGSAFRAQDMLMKLEEI